MNRVLVAINLNNTRTGVGFFAENGLLHSYSIPSEDLVQVAQTVLAGIQSGARVVVASVVPKATAALAAMLGAGGYQLEELRTQQGLGITFGSLNFRELGADLFANAIAVREIWGRDSLTVDLGTGSTFCVVKSGRYMGTSIVPGMELSLRALTDKAALLGDVPLARPDAVINTNTVACLQSGIYYGYTELVRGMIGRVQREQGKLFVVLTGGIGTFLSAELMDVVDVFEPSLSLLGIAIAAARVEKFPAVLSE